MTSAINLMFAILVLYPPITPLIVTATPAETASTAVFVSVATDELFLMLNMVVPSALSSTAGLELDVLFPVSVAITVILPEQDGVIVNEKAVFPPECSAITWLPS